MFHQIIEPPSAERSFGNRMQGLRLLQGICLFPSAAVLDLVPIFSAGGLRAYLR